VIQLADTLVALADGVAAADAPGLIVESAKFDVPLEGRVVDVRGTPTFFAQVPHTRWRSGVLPAVHVARFNLTEGEE
jgi:hypothetical protein